MTTQNTAKNQEAQLLQAIEANSFSQVPPAMIHAAMAEAVKQGIFPKYAAGEDDYLKKHAQMAAVLQACHQAQPEALHDKPTHSPEPLQRIMERAHALCPTDAPHPARMAWIASYYEMNRPGSTPQVPFAYHNPDSGEFLAASITQKPAGWDQLALITGATEAAHSGQSTPVNEVIREAIEAAFEQQNDHHQTTPKTGCEKPPEKHR